MTTEQLELRIGDFQGPFDLLLHLIKQMKVDINDIPMTEITQQYMAYLAQMKALELDIVGDYLVMAATLLEIKSRLLLPIEPEDDEGSDPDVMRDPRQALVQQLLLYQQFQDVAALLEEQQAARAQLFSKPADDLSAYQSFIPLNKGEITLDMLATSMANALKQMREQQPTQQEIYQDPQTVEQKMTSIMQVLDQLDKTERLGFSLLLTSHHRQEIITTFMAILELVRQQSLIFYQAEALGPIEIAKV